MPHRSLFRAQQYLKGSVWFYPLLGAILGPLVALLTKQADTSVSVPAAWQYTSGTATTVLSTIVGASVGLTGFVVTVTVLAIQMATGTFSARYMRIWYRDSMLKASLAVLVGTLTFSFSLLRQVGTTAVPNIGVTLAGFLLALSLVLFLLFFDRFIHRLRPVAVAELVGKLATRVITSVIVAAEQEAASVEMATGEPELVVSSRRAGALQALDVDGMVSWAKKGGHSLVMQAAVGDFVTVGQPLMVVFGGNAMPAKTTRHLQSMVALGAERTIEEDAAFAIRIIVDIAVKALSAAINDPTTAVQALDHLGNVLRLLGSTPLRGELTFPDEDGIPRLRMPGPTWEDYLALGVTEIREFGAGSIQVMRRLRALLEDLRSSVRPEHLPAVEAQLSRLDATIAASFAASIDRDLAQGSDRQGVGGPSQIDVTPISGSTKTEAEGYSGSARTSSETTASDGLESRP
jgi:uncharacterized membrane protein